MVLKRYGKLLWAALLLWCQIGFAAGGKVAESFDMPCPDGMSRSRLMTLSDAWRQTTPTRERISLNGLWEFHPVLAPDELEKIPGPETRLGVVQDAGSVADGTERHVILSEAGGPFALQGGRVEFRMVSAGNRCAGRVEGAAHPAFGRSDPILAASCLSTV